MEVDISITIPTRNRPDRLNQTIISIIETAFDMKRIQIVIRIDNDDNTTIEYLSKLELINKYNFIIIKGEYTKNIVDLWNECYSKCDGGRIMMCADDVIFRTSNWDSILIRVMPFPNSKPYFVWGNDKNQEHHLATLPIMSRYLIEKLGYFVPMGYRKEYCDTHLHDIMRKLEQIGYNIMTYLPDVIFEHMHPFVGKAQWDLTYESRRKFVEGDADRYKTYEKERNKEALELYRKIQDDINNNK